MEDELRQDSGHTWSGIRQIWEIHATSQPAQAERLHEFPKSDGFQAMYDSGVNIIEVLSLFTHSHDLAAAGFFLQLTVEAIDHNPEVDAEGWNDFIEYLSVNFFKTNSYLLLFHK